MISVFCSKGLIIFSHENRIAILATDTSQFQRVICTAVHHLEGLEADAVLSTIPGPCAEANRSSSTDCELVDVA